MQQIKRHWIWLEKQISGERFSGRIWKSPRHDSWEIYQIAYRQMLVCINALAKSESIFRAWQTLHHLICHHWRYAGSIICWGILRTDVELGSSCFIEHGLSLWTAPGFQDILICTGYLLSSSTHAVCSEGKPVISGFWGLLQNSHCKKESSAIALLIWIPL